MQGHRDHGDNLCVSLCTCFPCSGLQLFPTEQSQAKPSALYLPKRQLLPHLDDLDIDMGLEADLTEMALKLGISEQEH